MSNMLKYDKNDFVLTNARTGEKLNLNSNQLKTKIISETKSVYEDTSVLEERTGLRIKILESFLRKKMDSVQTDLYVVSAVGRINNDKKTRYIVIIDNRDYDYRINEIINLNIPIYIINYDKDDDSEENRTYFSKWFRENMGRAFSLIDVDYLLINKNKDKIVLIEEKVGKNSMLSLGYGQTLSYLEIIEDVINSKNAMLFIYIDQGVNINSNIKYCSIKPIEKINEIRNKKLKEIKLEEILNKISEFLNSV